MINFLNIYSCFIKVVSVVILLILLQSTSSLPGETLEYAFLSIPQWDSISDSADWAVPRYSTDSSQVCVKLKFGVLNGEIISTLSDAGIDTVESLKTHSQALTITHQWEIE